ncbi:hypothetical protein niasHT_014166 [Heterodera trifolii]|uniref:Uncharacterized protein n=1 Tax=Heterodera trifolii TaxID=157864 RepID=A0ABD2KXB6_9BILA
MIISGMNGNLPNDSFLSTNDDDHQRYEEHMKNLNKMIKADQKKFKETQMSRQFGQSQRNQTENESDQEQETADHINVTIEQNFEKNMKQVTKQETNESLKSDNNKHKSNADQRQSTDLSKSTNDKSADQPDEQTNEAKNRGQQPISEATRKWMKKLIDFIDKLNAKDCFKLDENDQNDQLPYAKEFMETKNELVKKLVNSKTVVLRDDVLAFFVTFHAYLDKLVEWMGTELSTNDVYHTKYRLAKAVEKEIESPVKPKQVAEFEKILCSKRYKDQIDDSFMDQCNQIVHNSFQKMQIFRCLATDKKQKEYRNFFTSDGQKPITNETRKWVKNSIQFIDKLNANGCFKMEENGQSDHQIPYANEFTVLKNELAKKLANSKTEVPRDDLLAFFDTFSLYLDELVEKMAKKLKKMDAYNSEFRLNKALEKEMESPKKPKGAAKFQKAICSQHLNK